MLLSIYILNINYYIAINSQAIWSTLVGWFLLGFYGRDHYPGNGPTVSGFFLSPRVEGSTFFLKAEFKFSIKSLPFKVH